MRRAVSGRLTAQLRTSDHCRATARPKRRPHAPRRSVILPVWAFAGRQRKSDSMLLEASLLEPYLQTIVHLAPSGMNEDGFILRARP